LQSCPGFASMWQLQYHPLDDNLVDLDPILV